MTNSDRDSAVVVDRGGRPGRGHGSGPRRRMTVPAFAQAPRAATKPNIVLIVSDDTGYGDLGPYGGGEGRGMPTPKHRPPGRGRDDVHVVLCPAELHAGPGRDADRPHPEPQRHDDGGVPGPGRRLAGG